MQKVILEKMTFEEKKMLGFHGWLILGSIYYSVFRDYYYRKSYFTYDSNRLY